MNTENLELKNCLMSCESGERESGYHRFRGIDIGLSIEISDNIMTIFGVCAKFLCFLWKSYQKS